jgi:nucleotidyltransferase AbiEii toxin of type IV toxin-antitoxin system
MKTERQKRRVNVVSTDPAWETAKAARRNLSHDEGVQEVFFLQRQFRFQWSNRVAASPVDLNLILKTLAQKRIPFILTGAHGISGWTGKPRNTQDVDLLVKTGRNHTRAVKAIKTLYPQLEVRTFPGVTAFFVPGEKTSVIDITYPHRADLEETLANPTWTENKEQGLRYRIPSLEEALANKYGAMLATSRKLDKRMQDAVDFTRMVQHSLDEGQQPIDLERLEILGEKVWPGGGGEEILRLVEQVKAGRAIDVDSLG